MSDDAKRRNRQPGYALVYASIIPIVQSIGRRLGYAIAVHGSMTTDLDLLACPWVEGAAEPEALIEAIKENFGLKDSPYCPGDNPCKKPHGRVSWCLVFDAQNEWLAHGPYLDISIMPRASEKV